MIVRIKNIFDSFKKSLWFIPMLMTLGGLLLSVVLFEIDWIFWKRGIHFFGKAQGTDPAGVRSFFSNIGGAIITAMTTILSVTLLIYTVLGGQFGSPILRVFKIKTFSKFVIGWFTGTYAYIIYHVYKISNSTGNIYIPHFSNIIGFILTIITIFLLIMYVHFLVKQIQSTTVISEIANELFDQIQNLEPLNPKENLLDEEAKPSKISSSQKKISLLQNVQVEVCGYIQGIIIQTLRELAEKNNWIIEIPYRVGNFVISDSVVAIVYTDCEIEPEIINKIKSCFILSDQRIPVEDLECNLELLVEMATRALSPGINDMMIANNAIDYIGESIGLLTKRKFPHSHIYRENGELLLRIKQFSFERYLEAALGRIRQYVIVHSSSTIRLLDSLISIARITDSRAYLEPIKRHFDTIMQSALKHREMEVDRTCIQQRNREFQSIIAAKGKTLLSYP